MTVSALTAALRIARRDAWQNKARSLLVVALVGLPVLGLSALDVGWRTYQLSPTQSLDRQIGSADLAVMSGLGGPVRQSPKGWLDGGGYAIGNGSTPAPQSEATLRTALPRGSRVVREVRTNQELALRTRSGLAYTPLIGLDYADPIARGLVSPVSGRAPRTPGQVALTSALAAETGLTVGQRTTVFDHTRPLTVVGIVHDSVNRDDIAMYTVPAGVSRPNSGSPTETVWLVRTGAPVSWSQVLRLNALGFVAVSREAYLHPPPASEIPYHSKGAGLSPETAVATALVVGLALLEIVLMAGPAFAVTARRQRRALALLAAAGGRRRDLACVVLAGGVVLGATAGVIGALGGIALCAALLAVLEGRIDAFPGPFDVHLADLMVVTLVSVVTALLAALLPAWSASRIDVVAALAGRRGQPRVRRGVPVVAVVVTGIGVLIATAGTAADSSVDVILAGVAVTEAGLIIAAPALISLVAVLGRWLPFAPRLALRDAARNRSSAAPAVAAIMACTVGAVAVAIVTASQSDLARRQYTPRLPIGVAYVGIGPPQRGIPQPTPSAVVNALAAHLSTREVVRVDAPQQPTCLTEPKPGHVCTMTSISVADPPTPDGGRSRYAGGDFPAVMAGDAGALRALFGRPEPRAAAALRSGKAVVVDPGALHDGRVALTVDGYSFVPSPTRAPAGSGHGPAVPPPTHRVVSVAAVAVNDGYPAAQVILPTAVATRLTGQRPAVVGLLAVLSHPPSDRQRQAVDGALAALQPGLRIDTEDGFSAGADWELYALLAAAMVIALGAAAVATALANIDGRADLVVLGAVGASPRTRRIVSMSRAAAVSGLGCLVGGVVGFVPALAWIGHTANSTAAAAVSIGAGRLASTEPHLRLVVPWGHLLLVVVGIPLVATLLGAAFSWARLASERTAE